MAASLPKDTLIPTVDNTTSSTTSLNPPLSTTTSAGNLFTSPSPVLTTFSYVPAVVPGARSGGTYLDMEDEVRTHTFSTYTA